MQNRRHSHTCSPVGRDSCVLVAGGKFGSTFLRAAEIYAPAQQCWTRIAELPLAAASQASLRLVDGRVAVFGGWEGVASCKHGFAYQQSRPTVAADTLVVPPEGDAQDDGAAPDEAEALPAEADVTEAGAPAVEAKKPHDMESGHWLSLQDMDFAAADFSMIAHPTHGAVVIRPDSQSGCVVVDKIDIDVQRGPGVGEQEGASAMATCASYTNCSCSCNWPPFPRQQHLDAGMNPALRAATRNAMHRLLRRGSCCR